MLKLLLLIPAFVLLMLGGEGLHHASRSREAAALTCEQFGRSRPRSHLVVLSGCEIDYAGAGYRQSRGHVVELFFPARPAGASPNMPAPVVAATRHPAAAAIIERIVGKGPQATPEEAIGAMQQALAVVQRPAAIEGLARAGILDQLRARRVLSGLITPIDDSAAVVDLGARPALTLPLLEVAAGLLLAAIPILLLRRAARLAQGATPVGPPDDTPVSSADAAPAGPALPRIMLLNLDGRFDLEALEHAPPLGSRTEVIGILQGIAPDLTVDGDGRILHRAGRALVIDLGEREPVATAIVDVRDADSIAVVGQILEMTGWRAYAPKLGRFLTM